MSESSGSSASARFAFGLTLFVLIAQLASLIWFLAEKLWRDPEEMYETIWEVISTFFLIILLIAMKTSSSGFNFGASAFFAATMAGRAAYGVKTIFDRR